MSSPKESIERAVFYGQKPQRYQHLGGRKESHERERKRTLEERILKRTWSTLSDAVERTSKIRSKLSTSLSG